MMRVEGALYEITMRTAVALVIGLAFAPVIRGITADLNASMGRVWPFVMEHCRAQSTPGCVFAEPNPLLTHVYASR